MSTEPKTTIALPFSPEDVRLGRVPAADAEKFDKAWSIVMGDPTLAFARKRLSIQELRHIIRAVAEAFRQGASVAKKPKQEPKEWIVEMRVERNITVVVEATDEDEARAKACDWDIIGEETPGDTIDWKVVSVEPN